MTWTSGEKTEHHVELDSSITIEKILTGRNLQVAFLMQRESMEIALHTLFDSDVFPRIIKEFAESSDWNGSDDLNGDVEWHFESNKLLRELRSSDGISTLNIELQLKMNIELRMYQEASAIQSLFVLRSAIIRDILSDIIRDIEHYCLRNDSEKDSNEDSSREETRGIDDARRERILKETSGADFGDIGMMCVRASTFLQRKDYVNAHIWFNAAAEHGNPMANFSLGIMHYWGHGVEANKKIAAKYFLQAANKGNPNAMCNLSLMYENGDGVEKNRKEWLRWLIAAAEAGDSGCRCDYALMLLEGDQVDKDEAKALALLEEHAIKEDRDAIAALSGLHLEGKIENSDIQRGLALLKKAASLGCAVSQRNLGIVYANGMFGLKRDMIKAIAWDICAAERGDEVALELVQASKNLGLSDETMKKVEEQIASFEIKDWNPEASQERALYRPELTN